MGRAGPTCVAILTTALVASLPTEARAFDSKGHDVIEALVYRTLIEGLDGQPARPEVIRDLVNDGALVPPVCFGEAVKTSEECRRAPAENPLLDWPEPLTHRPDANFRRQFSDAGQCFHFMGTLDDEHSPPMAGGHVPRALATTAIVRCRSLLDDLLRQIVLVGGRGTRESGYGLYELMHAVGDSFSLAHAERQPETHAIEFLRVWEPAAKLAGNRLGAYYSLSPTRHDADEPRDRAYVRNFAEVGGRPCKDLTGVPYAVPYACLSQEGELARQALVDLLVVAHDLRMARLASPDETTAAPERSPAWVAYKNQWFSPVHACHGEECTVRQPPERAVSNDAFLGLGTRYDPGRARVSLTANALWLRWSQDLNPFVYGFGAGAGYRRAAGVNQAIAEVGLIMALPVGARASVGITPAAVRVPFVNGDGPELVTQFFRVDLVPTKGTWFSLFGPAEVDWGRVRIDWSIGAAIGLVPHFGEVGGGALIKTSRDRAERHDDTWAPEPLWYGRLKGRRASLYAVGSATPIPTATAHSSEESREQVLGMGSLGVSFAWDRDPWHRALPTSYGGSAGLGIRRTTLEDRYLVVALSAEGRWYFLPPLGLSLVPIRIETGPRVAGSSNDPSREVSGNFFFQAGSRLGLAFTGGIVDFLIQGPTLVWHDEPFQDGEIVSVQMGIRLH
ncbi:hypothetical protein AKJ09_10634 [Labilithrix luteola]|uniref:Uncharacterized protein n=1 Tax=Labilithrix luteola TaxID=1391654 RepID=A0A0K1QDX3_9BACT|nr:hypothetical protein [Labilithrix luteola]AKV03971.1 hypothetical protein AKJ09_10634 [Labilithrix luteola]